VRAGTTVRAASASPRTGDAVVAPRDDAANVDRAAAAHLNADLLSRALARSRDALLADPDQSGRLRHAEAIEHLADYVNLLHQATQLTSYPLKLEFADGRWDVAESSLPARPRLGDWLSLPSGSWYVRGSQYVRPSVAGKPEREYLVCAPA